MGYPTNDSKQIEEITEALVEYQRKIDNGEKVKPFAKAPRLKSKAKGGTGKKYYNFHRYVVLSTLSEVIDADVDGIYAKCRLIVRNKDNDPKIGPYQLYYKETRANAKEEGVGDGDIDEAMKFNLIPVFPSDVRFGNEEDHDDNSNNNDNNNNAIVVTPTKKDKARFVNNKKKNRKTPSTPPPTPPSPPPPPAARVVLDPPHPIYVELIVGKAIQVLSTTNLLDNKNVKKKIDQHAKLLKALNPFVVGPVGKYFPSPGTTQWEDIKAAARCKCAVFYFLLYLQLRLLTRLCL